MMDLAFYFIWTCSKRKRYRFLGKYFNFQWAIKSYANKLNAQTRKHDVTQTI